MRGGRTALIVTLRMVDGRVRTMRSAAPDGRFYYDHGVELAAGKPSATYEPCAAVVSQRRGAARRT